MKDMGSNQRFTDSMGRTTSGSIVWATIVWASPSAAN
jgi:hypothetical protein